MACSKLFSGDIPELIEEIIKNLRYEHKTLHSCILVNRLWCHFAIPLLWEDPFSIKNPKNYHFIDIYLNKLNNDDKVKLSDYGINNNNLFSSNTLFNYLSFIKNLNTHKLSYSIGQYIKTYLTPITKYRAPQLILRLKIIKFIYKSLFRIFIENEVSLYSFEVMISDYFDEVYEIILQNPNFIRNIKNFKINLSTTISNNITRFLIFFGSNCNSISSFYIKFPLYQQINEENLSQFIDSQKNLEKILFRSNIYFPLYYTFLSLKNSNCSNTLNTIIFYYIDFKNTLVLSEVINQLNVLESIHIVCCSSLNSNFSQQINNIHKPFKLKTLILKTILHIESLKLLIRKSGDHLECFGNVDCRLHKSDKSSQLLESTLKYCNNIKFLYLQFASSYKKIDLLFSLIKNIKQNLNYLHIDVLSNISNISISSIILKNLGQILPRKLEYLSFCLDINDTNDLRMFYKNSQNTYIKKLSIHHSEINYNYDNVFSCTKQCIMKQERVKYLAVTETTNRGNQNKSLSFIKDEVKQYNSYGIQVLKHRDLIIDIRNFIEQHYY